MLRGRLVIDAACKDELEELAHGVADLQLVRAEVGVAGELLRSEYRPVAVVPLSPLAVKDSDAAPSGCLCRVYINPLKEV